MPLLYGERMGTSGESMSSQTAIGLLTVGFAVAVFVRHLSTPLLAVGLAISAVVLGVLADIDFRTFRLPNKIVGPFALVVIAAIVIHAIVQSDADQALFGATATLVWVAILLVLNSLGQVGMGDVKLAVPLGMIAGWLGVNALYVSMVVTALTSALYGIVVFISARKKEGKTPEVPYGPFLALGSVAGMLVG